MIASAEAPLPTSGEGLGGEVCAAGYLSANPSPLAEREHLSQFAPSAL